MSALIVERQAVETRRKATRAPVERRYAGSSHAAGEDCDGDAHAAEVHCRGAHPADAGRRGDPDAGGEPEATRSARRQAGARERKRQEQARDAPDDAEEGANERRAGDRAIVPDERRATPAGPALEPRLRLGPRLGIAGDERDQRQGQDGENTGRDAPATRVCNQPGHDRPNEPAGTRRSDQRPRAAGPAAVRGGPGRADHPEDPEAESQPSPAPRAAGRGRRRRLRRRDPTGITTAATSSGARVPKRLAAYPIGIAEANMASVVVVSSRPVSTEVSPRRAPHRRQERHERRLRDPVDEREDEQDAQLEVQRRTSPASSQPTDS